MFYKNVFNMMLKFVFAKVHIIYWRVLTLEMNNLTGLLSTCNIMVGI